MDGRRGKKGEEEAEGEERKGERRKGERRKGERRFNKTSLLPSFFSLSCYKV
jgi:hypothetical protein